MHSQISNTLTQLINAQRLKVSTRIFAPVLRMTTVSTAARLISLLLPTSTRLKSVSALALMLFILSSLMALVQTVEHLSLYLIQNQMKGLEMQSWLAKIRPLQFSQTLVLTQWPSNSSRCSITWRSTKAPIHLSRFMNSVNSIGTAVLITQNSSIVSATQMKLKSNSISSIKGQHYQMIVVLQDLLALKRILQVNSQ